MESRTRNLLVATKIPTPRYSLGKKDAILGGVLNARRAAVLGERKRFVWIALVNAR